jgi:hypothetical protein
MHPLYADESLVERVTQAHLTAGRTMFQLWLSDTSEEKHGRAMLDLVAPPHRARVVSLGSGVAGMEAVWQRERPDLRFTLVNASGSQLAQSLCQGERIEVDVVTYWPTGEPFDVAIVSYVLGHVPAAYVVGSACEMARTVLVLDIFDATDEQRIALAYDAPTSDVMGEDFEPVIGMDWHLHAPMAGESAEVQALVRSTRPACWIRRG